MLSGAGDTDLYVILCFDARKVDDTEYVESEYENIPRFDAPQGTALETPQTSFFNVIKCAFLESVVFFSSKHHGYGEIPTL